MSKIHRFPQGKRPERQLRRVPVKIGAKTLAFSRPLIEIFGWRLVKEPNGRLAIRRSPRKRR